ncbi:hypothetical protein ABL78_3741 [Leptomonas seymouri]|uniref:Uncharacterized protein n=1 Tax=Leptomonas seymouri TaxID=5684 RepID=A0A0N0P638_LEPSE|nr:hypothetical protein ABL78_3741 [Leptomonas seymouri]|eukprot:KPI87179.1 hypothetical protein ABL78_3741 [Leptomonas seymouri]
MFTTQSTLDEVVLKTVAFRQAAGSDTSCTYLQQYPALPTNSSPRWASSHPQLSAEATHSHGDRSDTQLHANPSFTFNVPSRSTTPQYFRSSSHAAAVHLSSEETEKGRQRQPDDHGAYSALREALERHEGALRAWADEPMQHVPPMQPSLLPRPMPSANLPASTPLFSETPSSKGDRSLRNTALSISALSGVSGAAAAVSSCRMALPVAELYCRVLAKDSIAGIGLPQRCAARGAATTTTGSTGATPLPQPDSRRRACQELFDAAAVEKGAGAVSTEHAAEKAPNLSSHEASTMEANCTAFQSSVSDTLLEPHPKEGRRLGERPMAATGASAHGAPLSPYQLPLRMRRDTAATLTNTSPGQVAEAVKRGHTAEDTRRTFLREQAQRYAQWRRRQVAVLHRLAPDMWSHALPPYAALDRTPQVMDSGLRYCASTVRQFQSDSGVVYV